MKNTKLMSRAELVRELIASSPTIAAETAATYVESRHSRRSSTRDALVCHKLAVARELLLRDLAERMKAEPILSSPGTVRDWLRLYCAHLEHEVFLVLHLDARNCLIEAEELFRGTLSHTSVFPREVVKSVLARNAAAVLRRQVLALVDVKVLDHFVVAGTSTLSFAESGLI